METLNAMSLSPKSRFADGSSDMKPAEDQGVKPFERAQFKT